MSISDQLRLLAADLDRAERPADALTALRLAGHVATLERTLDEIVAEAMAEEVAAFDMGRVN